jgi:hypothetical protein
MLKVSPLLTAVFLVSLFCYYLGAFIRKIPGTVLPNPGKRFLPDQQQKNSAANIIFL